MKFSEDTLNPFLHVAHDIAHHFTWWGDKTI